MEKELSPEEERENVRKVALENLRNETITNLASAYLVKNMGQYGEDGNSAIEQFKYFPTIQSKEGSELITNNLLSSRQDGERYTGNISEYKIISDCTKIMQQSLLQIKVQDILELIGSKEGIRGSYKSGYLSELMESKNEEDKKISQKIIESYFKSFTDIKVSEALNERANALKSGLEEILIEPKRK